MKTREQIIEQINKLRDSLQYAAAPQKNLIRAQMNTLSWVLESENK